MSFPSNVSVPGKANGELSLNLNPLSTKASRGIAVNSNLDYISLSHQSERLSFYSNDSRVDDDTKSNNDQKLPDYSKRNKENFQETNDFFYVNKNGFIQSIKPSKSKKAFVKNESSSDTQSKNNQKTNQLICTNLILEVYKNNKEAKVEEKRVAIEEDACLSEHRVVPGEMHPCRSFSTLNESSTNSLIERDIHGNIIINTNLTMEEPYIDITYDHVRYVNIFSLLCCWCFPITGIASIVFSRLTKKYYNMRNMQQAKKYLNRAEWLLMLTFFFGLTLLALIFAFLESSIFKSASHSRSTTTSVHHFH